MKRGLLLNLTGTGRDVVPPDWRGLEVVFFGASGEGLFEGPEIRRPVIVFFAKAPRIPLFARSLFTRCGQGDDFDDLKKKLTAERFFNIDYNGNNEGPKKFCVQLWSLVYFQITPPSQKYFQPLYTLITSDRALSNKQLWPQFRIMPISNYVVCKFG